MRNLLTVTGFLAAGLSIAGCGGGAGPETQSASPLADVYSGTGTANGTTDSFRISVTVNTLGRFSGAITDTTNVNATSISGSVSATGTVSDAFAGAGIFGQTSVFLTGAFTPGAAGKATRATFSVGSTTYTFPNLLATQN